MEKKYAEYLDEISSDELYEGLLGYGMFANKYLPYLHRFPSMIIAKTTIRIFLRKGKIMYPIDR